MDQHKDVTSDSDSHKVVKPKKLIKKVTKARNKLAELAERSSDGKKLAKNIRKFVHEADEDALDLIEREEYEAAFKVMHTALNFIKVQFQPPGSFERHVIPELLFKLNQLMAHLYNTQDNFDASLRFLEAAQQNTEEFMKAPTGHIYELLPAEAFLNAANTYMYINRPEQALGVAGKAEELVAKTLHQLNMTFGMKKQDRPLETKKLEKLIASQQDLQILCMKTLSEILMSLDQAPEAISKLKEGMILLEENFGPEYPLLAEFQGQMEAMTTHAMSKGGGIISINGGQKPRISALRRRGKVIRTYYKVTKRQFQQDQRPQWQLDEKKKACVGDLDCEVHEERLYAQQLLNMRNMQDEKYRVMELMLATRAATNRANSTVYYPAQQMIIPADEEAHSSSSSSSSSSNDSDSSKEKDIPPTEVEVEEASWKAIHKFNGPSYEAEEVPKYEDRDTMKIKHTQKEHRQSGQAWRNQDIKISVVAPPVAAIVAAANEPEENDRLRWAATFFQKMFRGYMQRQIWKERMRAVVVQYFIVYDGFRARVTVKHIKAKRTRNRRATHSSNGVQDQFKQETLSEELMDAYLIIVEAMDQYDYLSPKQPENKFTKIVEEIFNIPRVYLIDYLKVALKLTWAGQMITAIQFRFLEDDELEDITAAYLKLIDRWELCKEMAARMVSETDYKTDAGNWRTQTNLKAFRQIETEQEKVARIRGKMAVYAAQTLTPYERRMLIEFEARQIMTKGKFRQITFKKLVKVDKNKNSAATNIIHINKLQAGQLALVRYMKHEKLVTKFQAIIRGYLARCRNFRLLYQRVCKFELNQMHRLFDVEVFKLQKDLPGKDMFHIRVTNLKSSHTYKTNFGNIGFGEADMEGSLKRMMEVLLFDEKIVGVRLGRGSTAVASNDFISDWKHPPANSKSDRYPIRNFIVLPQFEVTFFFVKTDGQQKSHGWQADHYLVEVKMNHPVGGVSLDYIRLLKLPVKLDYMVYYLRECLRVHLSRKNEQRIQYAALAPLDSEHAFLMRVYEIEKEFLASKRGVEMELGKRKKHAGDPRESHALTKRNEEDKRKKQNTVQSAMFQTSCSPDKRATSPEKKNKRMDLEDPKHADHIRMKMEFVWKGETYNVYMTNGFHQLASAKYQDHVVVVKAGDNTNYDYIGLSGGVRMKGQALQEFIKKNLQIYLIAAQHNKQDKAKIQAIKDRQKKRKNKDKKKSKSKDKKHKKHKKQHKKEKKYDTDQSSDSDQGSSDSHDIDMNQFVTQKIDYIGLDNREQLMEEGPYVAEVVDNDMDDDALWALEQYVKIQSNFRRYLARKTYLRMVEGKEASFFMMLEKDRAMITVRKVKAAKTTTRHTTHRQGKDPSHIANVDKHSEVVGATKVDAYLIIAENTKDLDNKKECVTQHLPPRNQLIDYLREALTVKWQAGRITQFTYSKLSDDKEKGLSAAYRKYGQAIELSKKKLVSWTQCFTYEKQQDHHHEKRRKEHYTLFQCDLTHDLSKPFVRVLCTAHALDEKEPEDHFKSEHVLGSRTFNGLECFMYLNPSKEPANMNPLEIESKISYSDQMEAWDKLLMCFKPQVIGESSDGKSRLKGSDHEGLDLERKSKTKLKGGYTGYLEFDERKFREIRYGFIPNTNASISQTSAILVLQKAVKRWLKRKRGKEMRRRRGFMSSNGVVRICGLTIAFVMMADQGQKNFTVTVKEQDCKKLSKKIHEPIFKGAKEPEHMFAHTVINKHKLSPNTIQQCLSIRDSNKHEDCEFILQAGAIIMNRLLRDQGVNAVSQANSEHGEPHKDWKARLARVIQQQM